MTRQRKSFEYYLRRLFPSASRLTFNPVAKLILDASDLPARLIWKEYRNIPPNHMRVRVGVGNRIFNNQTIYTQFATNYWLSAFANGHVALDSTIVDIGVGSGRYAHILRDFRCYQERFRGTYIGIDIDQEMVEYCRSSFDRERFRFHLSTNGSASYNRQAESQDLYRIPEADQSVDYVFSTSLLTHLLETELENYLRESVRLLRKGGRASHTFFSMDHPPVTFGNRHTFSHRIGPAYVESLAQPEAAVAYREAFLMDLVTRVGFEKAEVIVTTEGWQQVLLCQK
jgi:SAM-dependent methyltransferase